MTVEQCSGAEALLAEHAETFTPPVLATIARQLVDTLDPDGTLADEQAQARRRGLSLFPIGDGMHRISGDRPCRVGTTRPVRCVSLRWSPVV